ncbi:MAG: ribosomal protein S18-alanine N-acetyltransferase [Alphaproteobacteria bacterium]|nr:ribosomal protein S18-alanine N-acetyltransferase [Alphaproteobacteria bacterium]
MLNKIANLHKLCFPDKPWDAEEFASLQRSGAQIIVSKNGFIVWRCAADECEIITIGVHPDYRGTGVADALLQLIEKEISAKKIFLEVAENNHAARKLYERNGYKQIATRPKYYDNIDAIIMEKRL